MDSRANSGTNKCSIAQLGGRAVLMPSCLFNGGKSCTTARLVPIADPLIVDLGGRHSWVGSLAGDGTSLG